MTIMEAVATGLPIQRKGWGYWMDLSKGSICVSKEDLDADDWVVKKEPSRVYILYRKNMIWRAAETLEQAMSGMQEGDHLQIFQEVQS